VVNYKTYITNMLEHGCHTHSQSIDHLDMFARLSLELFDNLNSGP